MTESTFHKKKSLGQNFLTSPVVPGWMCDAAHIITGETIFEIGPGTGALTRELLQRGAKVVALEADERAITVLKETFPTELANGLLELHHGDARELDITNYSFTNHNFKVVANIPYYLTGYLFRTLLEHKVQPSQIVFLIQKEVAKRIARDTKSSLLSLSIEAFGQPHYVTTVLRGHFTPPPKIDSAIISIEHINQEHFISLSPTFFFEMLHLGFGQKRKQLLGNLAAHFERNQLTHIFSTLALPLDVRAEDLSLEIWLQLVQELQSINT